MSLMGNCLHFGRLRPKNVRLQTAWVTNVTQITLLMLPSHTQNWGQSQSCREHHVWVTAKQPVQCAGRRPFPLAAQISRADSADWATHCLSR